MNIEEFLKEKLNNFKNFCFSKFPNNEKIKKQSEDLATIDINNFIIYVKNFLLPHNNNLPLFIEKLIKEYEIDISPLNDEEKEKFKKYFELFIEVCKEI